MYDSNIEKKIYYALRIACAMCFIGHGSFGMITKEIWTHYFAVFGIGHYTAYQLMPYAGAMDILCGIIILVYPARAVIIWLAVWGFITAMLRPLSGEPFAEFIERFGNFGAPLALLIYSGNVFSSFEKLLKPVKPSLQLDHKTLERLFLCLRIVVFFLLCGHGWLNFSGKKALLEQYGRLGFSNPAQAGQLIGVFEMAAGAAILVKPFRYFVLVLFCWKVFSEFFYPKYEVFEWIERGGSYGSLLALYFVLGARLKYSNAHEWHFRRGNFPETPALAT